MNRPPLSWIRSEILSMKGYSVLESPDGTIKLDAMENPFGLPEDVRSKLSREVSALSFNRYPDPHARELKEVVSKVIAIPPGRLFLGNGSDEVLLNVFLATSGTIVVPEPTFSMYRIIAGSIGRTFRGMDLLPDFSLDLDGVDRMLRDEPPGVLVLASPNNPTGLSLSMESIGAAHRIATKWGFTTLVDEAYFPFHGETVLQSLPEAETLLVLRTFSKMGLAGLRLGVLIASQTVIEMLDKIRLPYNMDALTQKAAAFLLRESLPLLNAQVQEIVDLREKMTREMAAISGVTPFPSRSNFILFRVEGPSPATVFRTLLAKGILVRDVSGHHPLLSGTLRVTVGTGGENRTFLAALKEGMKS